MSVTLARPTIVATPQHVAPHRVTRVDVFDVPTMLREHAHTVIGSMAFGPGEHWLTIGVFYPDGVTRTLVARYTRIDGMSYGYVIADVCAPRALLACSVCGDRRPDADVEGEGVSVGAPCRYWLDCAGVYRDIR